VGVYGFVLRLWFLVFFGRVRLGPQGNARTGSAHSSDCRFHSEGVYRSEFSRPERGKEPCQKQVARTPVAWCCRCPSLCRAHARRPRCGADSVGASGAWGSSAAVHSDQCGHTCVHHGEQASFRLSHQPSAIAFCHMCWPQAGCCRCGRLIGRVDFNQTRASQFGRSCIACRIQRMFGDHSVAAALMVMPCACAALYV
jgi:hypothetical protein